MAVSLDGSCARGSAAACARPSCAVPRSVSVWSWEARAKMSSLFASRQARQGPVGGRPADESRRAAHQAHDPSAPLGPTNKRRPPRRIYHGRPKWDMQTRHQAGSQGLCPYVRGLCRGRLRGRWCYRQVLSSMPPFPSIPSTLTKGKPKCASVSVEHVQRAPRMWPCGCAEGGSAAARACRSLAAVYHDRAAAASRPTSSF